jgi:hypothetical protein
MRLIVAQSPWSWSLTTPHIKHPRAEQRHQVDWLHPFVLPKEGDRAVFETKIPQPKSSSPLIAVPLLSLQPGKALIQRKCECGGRCDSCATAGKNEYNPDEFDQLTSAARIDHDFSSIPIHPSADSVYPAAAPPRLLGQGLARSPGALEVSEPSDPAERDADQVAEQLFPPSSQPEHASSDVGRVTAIDEWAPTRVAQRQSVGAGIGAPRMTCGNPTMLPGGAGDRGDLLPVHTRTEMEKAFGGADFSSVRIHTNSGAAQLSRSLKAQAFTYGNDIFFDQGKYDPESARGKRLLAHELTHTVQQRDAIAMLARQGGGRTTLQCVNENLSSAGVAAWLLAIVGTACGLIFGIAGSPTGPGAAGTAAFGAAVCIAGVIGASVGFVLGFIEGCWHDPNFKSRGAHPGEVGGSASAGSAGGASGARPGGIATT